MKALELKTDGKAYLVSKCSSEKTISDSEGELHMARLRLQQVTDSIENIISNQTIWTLIFSKQIHYLYLLGQRKRNQSLIILYITIITAWIVWKWIYSTMRNQSLSFPFWISRTMFSAIIVVFWDFINYPKWNQGQKIYINTHTCSLLFVLY